MHQHVQQYCYLLLVLKGWLASGWQCLLQQQQSFFQL
jgi:hypothetical protein